MSAYHTLHITLRPLYYTASRQRVGVLDLQTAGRKKIYFYTLIAREAWLLRKTQGRVHMILTWHRIGVLVLGLNSAQRPVKNVYV